MTNFLNEIKQISKKVEIEKNRTDLEEKIKEEERRNSIIEKLKMTRYSEEKILSEIKEAALKGRKEQSFNIYNEQEAREAFWTIEIISHIYKILVKNGFSIENIKKYYHEVRWSDDTLPYDNLDVIVSW